MVEQRAGDVLEVGDRGVGQDQLRVRMALDQVAQVVGDRGQAAAGVDQDGHAPLGRDAEHRVQGALAEVEGLGARMQLDAAGAGVERALGLLDRPLGQVEPAERDEHPLRRRRPLEHAVVRHAVGRMPLGVVRAGRRTPARRRARASSSMSSAGVSAKPSSSRPRCVWASQMRRPSGCSAATRSSCRRRSSSKRAMGTARTLPAPPRARASLRRHATSPRLIYADSDPRSRPLRRHRDLDRRPVHLRRDRRQARHRHERARGRRRPPHVDAPPMCGRGPSSESRELIKGGMDWHDAELEVVRRALREAGRHRGGGAAVFPVELADYLRGHGVAVHRRPARATSCAGG